MNDEVLYAKLAVIIHHNRDKGCYMADESLIKPAIRRWKSYSRRHPHSKTQSYETRVSDLNKGLLSLFPNQNVDQVSLAHIAEDFAEVLSVFRSK